MKSTTEELLENFVKASMAQKALEAKVKTLEEELQNAKMRAQLTYDIYIAYLRSINV